MFSIAEDLNCPMGIPMSNSFSMLSESCDINAGNSCIQSIPMMQPLEILPAAIETEIFDEILKGFAQEERTLQAKLPLVVNSVFKQLKNKESVVWEDLIEFWKSVNNLVPDLQSAITQMESSITYYIGDTHGSYREVIVLIEYLEKMLEIKNNIKIVFIGDYVDRNAEDLENITLIAAFYLHYPKNVVLMRGNHEDKIINEHYGFIQNLKDNLIIMDRVVALYSEILYLFTNIPVGNINTLTNGNKDGKNLRIFAAHGGIPVDPKTPEIPLNLQEINPDINYKVIDYEQFNHHMSWLLWADPKEEVKGVIDDKFTGRSQFGPDIFQKFLKENDLDFMVRAHEKWPTGYKFFFNQQLISLFSTSFYSGRKIGEAAFIRVEYGKPIKLLQIKKDMLDHDFMMLKSPPVQKKMKPFPVVTSEVKENIDTTEEKEDMDTTEEKEDMDTTEEKEDMATTEVNENKYEGKTEEEIKIMKMMEAQKKKWENKKKSSVQPVEEPPSKKKKKDKKKRKKDKKKENQTTAAATENVSSIGVNKL